MALNTSARLQPEPFSKNTCWHPGPALGVTDILQHGEELGGCLPEQARGCWAGKCPVWMLLDLGGRELEGAWTRKEECLLWPIALTVYELYL